MPKNAYDAYEKNKVIGIIVNVMGQCEGEVREQRRRMSVDAAAVAELGKAVAELGKAYALLNDDTSA